jgi:hypothetical protein
MKDQADSCAKSFLHVCDKIPPNASIPLALLNKTLTPTKTVTAQTTTDNDGQKKPTSDNVSTPAAPLPSKPPCECMCPLEQRAGGTSKTEWTTEVVDDSAVSKPPKKEKTPHSDTKTALAAQKTNLLT